MPRISRKKRTEQNSQAASRIYKAAIYVRLSVEDARKKSSDSIGTQKTLLLDYINSHPDITLHNIYEDVNYTGTNFNRPAFTQMIEDIKSGLVDCVVVKDLSRFGRSFEETGHFLERVFPFLQVRFISIGDNYDSVAASVDDSSLIVPLKNLVNEIYARDISKKVKAGKKTQQQRGGFVGPFAPYGYIKEGSSFVVDSETAPVVRQIFEWIIEGFSDSAIAGRLNALKISPPSRYRFEKGITKSKKHEQTRFWYKSAVKRISEYPVYTGVMASGKYQSHFLSGGGVTVKSQDEWVITENSHPAIINRDTYEAVKKIRRSRKEKYQEGSTDASGNIFKGVIFCGGCGSHMTRRKRRTKHSYLCNVYFEVDRSACTAKTIREGELRTALFEFIRREISLAADIEKIIAGLQNRDDYVFRRGIAGKSRQETTLSRYKKWISAVRHFESGRELFPAMVSALVKRIDVYDNARIEITLRYRDELEAIHGYLTSNEQDVMPVCRTNSF